MPPRTDHGGRRFKGPAMTSATTHARFHDPADAERSELFEIITQRSFRRGLFKLSSGIESNLYFDGTVSGDAIEGLIKRGVGSDQREIKWRANRVANAQ